VSCPPEPRKRNGYVVAGECTIHFVPLDEPMPIRVCTTCRRSYAHPHGTPRWENDRLVIAEGWDRGDRCPECGAALPVIEAWEGEGGSCLERSRRPLLEDPEFRAQAATLSREIDDRFDVSDDCASYPPCGGCGNCCAAQAWYGLHRAWGMV
jgi:hypothetical protein